MVWPDMENASQVNNCGPQMALAFKAGSSCLGTHAICLEPRSGGYSLERIQLSLEMQSRAEPRTHSWRETMGQFELLGDRDYCPQGHPHLSWGDLTQHMVKPERDGGPPSQITPSTKEARCPRDSIPTVICRSEVQGSRGSWTNSTLATKSE